MDMIVGTPEYKSESKRPVRDSVILGVAFLCVFTSYQALQNLQSSLHQQEGLGIASLACVYGAEFLSSFATPAIVFNGGIKGTILLGWLIHCVYVVCNIWTSWLTLIPGSLLLGLVSAPLWTAVRTYMSALARVKVDQDMVAKPKQVSTVHAAFSQLNGLFHSIFVTSQLTGNLISSLIFMQSQESGLNRLASVGHCGVQYCPDYDQGQELTPPENKILYSMLAVFIVFDVVGFCVTWKFTPKVEQPYYAGREVVRKLRSYWQAFCQPKFFLLIPLWAARGMNVSLHIGMFTEAYVSCALGMKHVGYIMAVWGGTTILAAALLGYAAKFTGRKFLFGFAFFVDLAILTLLLFWTPHTGSYAVMICVVALMGLVDGIWSVQCHALVAVMFPAIVDAAFSGSQTFHALSTAVSFVLARYLCPAGRIYITMAVVAVGIACYAVVEIYHHRSLKLFNREDDNAYMLVRTGAGVGDEDDEDDDVVELNMEETRFDANHADASVGGRGGGEAGRVEDRLRLLDDGLNGGETEANGGVGLK